MRPRASSSASCPSALLGQAQALFEASPGWVLPWPRLADLDGFIQAVTVQAIAAAELLARHFGVQRVLVVCPTSLKLEHRGRVGAQAR